MSVNDNSDLSTRSWFPYQRNLIYLVKKYPITYHPLSTKRHSKLARVKLEAAWNEIGTQLCQPNITSCKNLWSMIKLKYAKIMNLINTGKITKKAAMSHPETCKFFDGLLSFLDPFISKITDETIPFRIHKSINDIFRLNTVRTHQGATVASKKSDTQFVTHTQVKALLRERHSNEEQNFDIMEPEYLQIVVNTAVRRKLEELLKKDDLSNPSDDTITIINVPRTPSKDLRNVRKRMPNFTLVPSKNILNNDEENTTKTVNLGLATELIIEDDIKREAEDDNIKREAEHDNIKMDDDDHIKEENLTLNKKLLVNNATDEQYDLENILPSTTIIMPAAHDTMTNTTSNSNNDVTADINETPVSDDYIRNFFSELGEVMGLELSISKKNTLKSQLNKLLKDILLNENGHKGEFTSLTEDQVKSQAE